jgi:hypothetical protein
MKMHRLQSRMNGLVDSARRGQLVMSSLVLLGLGVGACGDDSGSGDTIDDTQSDVDSADADTVDTTGDTTPPDGLPDTSNTGTVIINELAALGAPEDWVEFHNPGTSPVDISGWLFRDNDETHAYVFPAGSVVAAGGYKVVERLVDSGNGFDFGLGGADGAFLYDPNDRLVDQTTWLEGDSPVAGSWGRIPNASGAFKTLIAPTPGAANVDNPAQTCPNGVREGLEVCDGTDFGALSCQSLGWGGGSLTCLEQCTRIGVTSCTAREAGLVINEVESDEQDRIELFNGSGAAVNVGGFTLTDMGDNVFTIPVGTTIEAGAYKVFTRDVDHTFGLGDADGVTLARANGEVIDMIGWQRGQAIPSFCRLPSGTGGFATCDNQTFGGANF